MKKYIVFSFIFLTCVIDVHASEDGRRKEGDEPCPPGQYRYYTPGGSTCVRDGMPGSARGAVTEESSAESLSHASGAAGSRGRGRGRGHQQVADNGGAGRGRGLQEEATFVEVPRVPRGPGVDLSRWLPVLPVLGRAAAAPGAMDSGRVEPLQDEATSDVSRVNLERLTEDMGGVSLRVPGSGGSSQRSSSASHATPDRAPVDLDAMLASAAAYRSPGQGWVRPGVLAGGRRTVAPLRVDVVAAQASEAVDLGAPRSLASSVARERLAGKKRPDRDERHELEEGGAAGLRLLEKVESEEDGQMAPRFEERNMRRRGEDGGAIAPEMAPGELVRDDGGDEDDVNSPVNNSQEASPVHGMAVDGDEDLDVGKQRQGRFGSRDWGNRRRAAEQRARK